MKQEHSSKLSLVKHNLFYLVSNKNWLFYQLLILINVFSIFLLIFIISQRDYYTAESKIYKGIWDFLIDEEKMARWHSGAYIINDWWAIKDLFDTIWFWTKEMQSHFQMNLNLEDSKINLEYVDKE